MVFTRRPVYPTQQAALRQQIEGLLRQAPSFQPDGIIVALVVPDTNLLDGGAVSAEVFNILRGRDFDTVIVISPSNIGEFNKLSICSIDRYHTPLGEVEVNDHMRNELCDEDDDIYMDDTGHYHTEGVDVQLPYLQTLLSRFDIVPIVMGVETPDYCKELGAAVGEISYGRKVLVVASCDLRGGDEAAFERFRTYFEAMDVPQLMYLLNSEEVLLEGKGAVLVAVLAALRRGANRARLLRLVPPDEGGFGYVGGVIWKE